MPELLGGTGRVSHDAFPLAIMQEREVSPDLREAVIQYKGGGYDGCFWEWNFFLVDHEGRTWDLFSSGYSGLDTDDKRTAFLEDPDATAFVYRVGVKEDVNELNSECSPTHAVGVVDKVNKIYSEELDKDMPMWVVCDMCKEGIHGTDLYPYEISFVEWHGCGGIMSAAGKKICNDCHSCNSCGYCGEFDPDDDYDNEEGMCSYCWADHIKQNEKQGELTNG